jgi:hypothetical protein
MPHGSLSFLRRQFRAQMSRRDRIARVVRRQVHRVANEVSPATPPTTFPAKPWRRAA